MIKLIYFSILLAFIGILTTAPLRAGDENIRFSADKVIFDSKAQTTIATGNVILFQRGTSLRAEQVVFYKKTGVVEAQGNIFIQDKNGNVSHMEKARLEGNLREGYIENTRILFSDGGQLVAKDAIRTNGKTILTNATYSPCEICLEKGIKKPLWQIRADEITHDEADKLIRYKNVLLEIKGIPVFSKNSFRSFTFVADPLTVNWPFPVCWRYVPPKTMPSRLVMMGSKVKS